MSMASPQAPKKKLKASNFTAEWRIGGRFQSCGYKRGTRALEDAVLTFMDMNHETIRHRSIPALNGPQVHAVEYTRVAEALHANV